MPTRARANDPDYDNGVYYPSSDGKPMAETEFHIDAIIMLLEGLKDYFAARTDVYVVGNINWYWEEGNRRACRSPDTMVFFGVEPRRRRSFRSWNEGGAVPRVCFEMASQRTWRANLGEVRDDYEANGVREYFVFDPTREYLPTPLVGYRLRNGVYQPMRVATDWSLTSRELGLKLLPEGIMLRLVDAKTGMRVLTRPEQAEAERHRAEMARQIAEAARQTAEAERQAAEAERQAAEAERQRANLLAAEVERLKALLHAKNGAQ
jgi:Uma2 family endonuclease